MLRWRREEDEGIGLAYDRQLLLESRLATVVVVVSRIDRGCSKGMWPLLFPRATPRNERERSYLTETDEKEASGIRYKLARCKPLPRQEEKERRTQDRDGLVMKKRNEFGTNHGGEILELTSRVDRPLKQTTPAAAARPYKKPQINRLTLKSFREIIKVLYKQKSEFPVKKR